MESCVLMRSCENIDDVDGPIDDASKRFAASANIAEADEDCGGNRACNPDMSGQQELVEGICCVEDPTGNAEADWSNMVGEVLVLIFSFLTTEERLLVACVCKTWCSASYDPACWTKVQLTRMVTKKCRKDILLRSRGQLIDLSLDHTMSWTLRLIGNSCPLLQRVNLSFLFLSDESCLPSVEAFVRGCPRVHSLKLWPIHKEGFDNILLDCIRILVTGLPHLVSLTLQGHKITDEGIGIIARHASQLKSLSFQAGQITAAGLLCLGQRLLSLRSLHIEGDMGNDELSSIVNNFPRLEALVLMWTKVSDDSLELVRDKMFNLEVFRNYK